MPFAGSIADQLATCWSLYFVQPILLHWTSEYPFEGRYGVHAWMPDDTAKIDDYARFENALLAFMYMKHGYCKMRSAACISGWRGHFCCSSVDGMELGWLSGRPRHDEFGGDDAGVSVCVQYTE